MIRIAERRSGLMATGVRKLYRDGAQGNGLQGQRRESR